MQTNRWSSLVRIVAIKAVKMNRVTLGEQQTCNLVARFARQSRQRLPKPFSCVAETTTLLYESLQWSRFPKALHGFTVGQECPPRCNSRTPRAALNENLTKRAQHFVNLNREPISLWLAQVLRPFSGMICSNAAAVECPHGQFRTGIRRMWRRTVHRHTHHILCTSPDYVTKTRFKNISC